MAKLYKFSLFFTAFCVLASCNKDNVEGPDNIQQKITISGRIVDFQNNPMGGVHVGFYLEKNRRDESMDRSEFILKTKAVTGLDGRYSLTIERGSDEYDKSYESDAGMVHEKNRYLINVDEVLYDCYYNRSIFYADNSDSFWNEGNREFDDYTLYKGKYLSVILNKVHPASIVGGCKIYHSFSENYFMPNPECVSSVPFQTSFLYPVGRDLYVLIDWGNNHSDTLSFTYPDIPGIIDASYRP